MLKDTDTVADVIGELNARLDAALAVKKEADAKLATVVAEVKRITNTDSIPNARAYMNDYMDVLNHPGDLLGTKQLVKDVFNGFKPQLTRELIVELDSKHSKAEQAANRAEAKYKRMKEIYNYFMEMIQT